MLDKGIYEAIKKIDPSVLDNLLLSDGGIGLRNFIVDTIENKEKYVGDSFYTSDIRSFLIYLFGLGKEEELSTHLYDLEKTFEDKNYIDCMYVITLLEMANDITKDIPWACYFDEVFASHIIKAASRVLEEEVKTIILELTEGFRHRIRVNLGF